MNNRRTGEDNDFIRKKGFKREFERFYCVVGIGKEGIWELLKKRADNRPGKKRVGVEYGGFRR